MAEVHVTLCLLPLLWLAAMSVMMSHVYGLSSKDKELILTFHNKERRNTSPMAADMRQMEWDNGTEDLAKQWASLCKYNTPPAEMNVGVNYYYTANVYRKKLSQQHFVRTAVKHWVNHKRRFQYAEECGRACSYVKMVFAQTDKIGCAFNICPTMPLVGRDTAFLTCFYPTTQVNGGLPYQMGPACSRCPKGWSCSDRLCIEGHQALNGDDKPTPSLGAKREKQLVGQRNSISSTPPVKTSRYPSQYLQIRQSGNNKLYDRRSRQKHSSRRIQPNRDKQSARERPSRRINSRIRQSQTSRQDQYGARNQSSSKQVLRPTLQSRPGQSQTGSDRTSAQTKSKTQLTRQRQPQPVNKKPSWQYQQQRQNPTARWSELGWRGPLQPGWHYQIPWPYNPGWQNQIPGQYQIRWQHQIPSIIYQPDWPNQMPGIYHHGWHSQIPGPYQPGWQNQIPGQYSPSWQNRIPRQSQPNWQGQDAGQSRPNEQNRERDARTRQSKIPGAVQTQWKSQNG